MKKQNKDVWEMLKEAEQKELWEWSEPFLQREQRESQDTTLLSDLVKKFALMSTEVVHFTAES